MEGAVGKTKRLAILVGCNYPNTRHQLNGCVNDVHAMRRLLVSALAFVPADVLLLTDDVDVPAQQLPTGANIRRALADMISRAAPGDVLFFHFSGHGTLIPLVKPHHSWRSSRDEAIVPCDFNLITDVDFRQLVDRLPAGASFTMISDSCHSGGLIDEEKEQIGPSTVDRSTTPTSTSPVRERAIPFESVLSHLSTISGLDSPHVGDHLTELFGGEASLKFWKGRQPEQRRHEDDVGSDGAILLSGCQTDETSADMSPLETTEGKSYGAFSDALQTILRRRMETSGTMPTNRELVMEAREVLRARGFEQHPCLYCADDKAEEPFLWSRHAHHMRAAM